MTNPASTSLNTPCSGSTGKPGARILVVEDHAETQRLVASILRSAGYDVEISSNGQEALQKCFASIHDEKPFSLILMDMQMPVMDGFAATRELRRLGHRCPIVALTGLDAERDREACLAAGCNSYIAKPVHRRTVLDTIARLMNAPPIPD
jgi:CheY-like chemotaxis protein